jgi:hypothetical protein
VDVDLCTDDADGPMLVGADRVHAQLLRWASALGLREAEG